MNKIIEAMVAARNRFAKELSELRAAADGSIPESAEHDAAAAIAKLNGSIEDGKKLVERIERWLQDGRSDTIMEWTVQYRDLKIEEVIRRALQGDISAHNYLCSKAVLALGPPWDDPLRAYAAKVLMEEVISGSRGKGRPTKWARNKAIVLFLNLLETLGIPPTRNCATDPEQECGSRIVAEWLNDLGDDIGEAGVAKIREKYQERLELK